MFQIQIDDKQKYEIILKNILIMLKNRNEIDNPDKVFEQLTKKNLESQKYILISEKKKYYVKYVLNKSITKKEADIEHFLDEFKKYNKILVVLNINKKIFKSISEHSNIEIFWDKELLINLIDHDIMPRKVTKLTDKEKKEVLESYNLTELQLPQIYRNDPLSKYFKGEINDIFRIERYNPTCGISVIYRIVVPSVDINLYGN